MKILMISVCFAVIATTFSWNSDIVEKLCPLFVLAKTGEGGPGDQLERYSYSLFLAKIFQATTIVEGFKVGPIHHSGTSEYLWIASQLFGIKMVHNLSYVSSL
jgi:hypothetical protein